MILCIDSGNSRIKWALHDGRHWSANGALVQADAAALAELPRRFTPDKIMLANVAGPQSGEAIRQALAVWQARLVEVRSSACAAGVRSHYQKPQQLGVDRWSALIGARSLHPHPCLVVMAGTATTIDTLDADGNFPGGLILPGIDLMRRALSRDTAALPLAEGHHQPYPTCTDDAIISGCLEAQAGAIERAFRRLAGQPRACCLLSGGAAPLLAPLLGIPCRLIDNLVLEGLYQLARETDPA